MCSFMLPACLPERCPAIGNVPGPTLIRKHRDVDASRRPMGRSDTVPRMRRRAPVPHPRAPSEQDRHFVVRYAAMSLRPTVWIVRDERGDSAQTARSSAE